MEQVSVATSLRHLRMKGYFPAVNWLCSGGGESERELPWCKIASAEPLIAFWGVGVASFGTGLNKQEH